ncbi:MAG: hypothetical protein AAB225_13500 [Acidobacteriota bacterium]
MEPQDTVSLIDNRWVTVRQVARPEDVPEAPAVTALRTEAQREADLLDKVIRAARTQGIPVIYAERHLVTADLGLNVRPRLAWFDNYETKRQMFRFIAQSCRTARRELEDKHRYLSMRPLGR